MVTREKYLRVLGTQHVQNFLMVDVLQLFGAKLYSVVDEAAVDQFVLRCGKRNVPHRCLVTDKQWLLARDDVLNKLDKFGAEPLNVLA